MFVGYDTSLLLRYCLIDAELRVSLGASIAQLRIPDAVFAGSAYFPFQVLELRSSS